MLENTRTLLSLVGLASQFGASVLLVTLYLLLGRERRGRGYFRLWRRAWVVLMLTLGVLMVRNLVLPRVLSAQQAVALLPAFLAIYQLGKLLWAALLLAGSEQYAHRVRRPGFLPSAVVIASAYAVGSALLSRSMAEEIVWQSPVAATALAYCAWLMLRLPPQRRTLGSRFTGGAFLANALLWAAYGPLFLYAVRHAARPPFLDMLVSGHSFLDQILGIALGYGMVVVLLEDAKREVDAAHAELSLAHQELRDAAMFDPLTGALNRRAFEQSMGLDAGWASFGAVGMLDLDDLKAVNDHQGHAAGDRLLRRFAEEMRAALRPSDRLYRWGGDEFLLVMPGAGAADLARRVQVILEGVPPSPTAGDPPLQVSFGAANYDGTDGLNRAIAVADRAMYAEKQRRKLPSTAIGRAVV